jgi:hypothetical protein
MYTVVIWDCFDHWLISCPTLESAIDTVITELDPMSEWGLYHGATIFEGRHDTGHYLSVTTNILDPEC